MVKRILFLAFLYASFLAGQPSSNARRLQGRPINPAAPTNNQAYLWTCTIGTAGFTGSGLNDATSGGTCTASVAALYTVAIDSAVASPDTFKWRKGSGSWTTGVSMTGSAQILTDGVTITFNATDGHTLADQWMISTLLQWKASQIASAVIGLPGPAGPAGPIGPAGPSGADGAPGVPGYSANALVSGGGVVWTGGLSFTVSAATYLIGGVQYTSPQTNLTLSTADPTNDRIDIIAVDTSSQTVVVAGTPAANPAAPDVDPATQMQLTFVYVATGALVPSNVVVNDVYHENVEWNTSRSGNPINLASTSNPHTGALDVEATSAVTGNYAQFVAPVALDLGTRNNLVFYIRSKATWASTRSLQIYFLSGTTRKGSIVVLNQGAFGFVSSTTTTYQQIVVPLSLFAANGLSVDRLRVIVTGSGTNLGFHLDDITLQGGVVPAGAYGGMMWKRAWNATTAYSVNDVVMSGGVSYIALLANTNVAVSTASTWKSLAPPASSIKGFGAQFGKCGGSPLTAGELVYLPEIPYACTITASSIVLDTGTTTFKVWRIADGTAIPTVANSINTSGISLSSGTRLRTTTVTDFTSTSIAAHDVLVVTLTAVASATCVGVFVECDIQ